MKKSLLFTSLLLTVYTLQINRCNAQSSKPGGSLPNIVLIYMDDMGYGDVDAYGGIDYITPNIDRLAATGMRFTNFYAAQPICTASRAALLTGCYPNRIGFHGAIGPSCSYRYQRSGSNDCPDAKEERLCNRHVWEMAFGGCSKSFLPLQHGFDEYLGLPYSNDMWPVDYDGKPLPILPTSGQNGHHCH